MKTKLKFSKAKKSEPYWWLKDDKNLIHRQYLSFYKCTDSRLNYNLLRVNKAKIYGLIVGKFHWRLFITYDGKSNTSWH